MGRKAARNGPFEAAMAQLIQNQAAFMSLMPDIYARFARIEADLEQIKAILLEHSRILNELPEAIRQKVGFKPQ